MNKQLKKRIILGSVLIVVVIVAVVAVVGNGSSAKTITVSQAQTQEFVGKKIQITGLVVDNSYSSSGKTSYFQIYDESNPSDGVVSVTYSGAIGSTFGNGVTAICTGTLQAAGSLQANELVTKCPSKYENSSNALTVEKFLDYGESVIGKTVKIVGLIQLSTMVSDGTEKIFVIADSQDGKVLKVSYNGALADSIKEGTRVVITGSVGEDQIFVATEVNPEG